MDGRSVIVGLAPLVGLVVVALITSAAVASDEEAGPASLELALIGDDGPRRLALDVEVDGEPVSARWDGAVAALLRHCDRDGDATLDEMEAAGLPSAFGLRQLGWGVYRLAGPAPPWGRLDADGDGSVGTVALSAFYLANGAGPILVGVGQAPFTTRLNEAIIQHLDADGDGQVDRAEARDAEALLNTLDRNGDGRLAAEEIAPAVSYPGTRGTSRLVPPSPDRPPGDGEALPIALLPPHDDGGRWAEGLSRLPDVSAIADALRTWRDAPPALSWTVAFGDTSGTTEEPASARSAQRLTPGDWLSASVGGLAFHLRADEGTFEEGLRAERERLAARFDAADGDADGEVRAVDAVDPSSAPLVLALPWADRDGDGAASRDELDAWSHLIDAMAGGLALITVLDHGRGLFEFIDSDHDGFLSTRELRTTGDRLERAGCLADGAIDAARLPRTLIGCVSRGHPRRVLAEHPSTGLAWFDGMDRNRDGDVSAGEWVGDLARFRSLDRDRDGLLDAEEAIRFP